MLEFTRIGDALEVRRDGVLLGKLRWIGYTPRIELETRYLRLDELQAIAERLAAEVEATA